MDILKKLQQRNEAEAKQFQEQAQTLTSENENLKDRCHEAEQLTVRTNQRYQELMTKV